MCRQLRPAIFGQGVKRRKVVSALGAASRLFQFRYNQCRRSGGQNTHGETTGVDWKFEEGPDGAAGAGGGRVCLARFQKKSKKGMATPKPDLDLIKDRLDDAAPRAKEIEDD